MKLIKKCLFGDVHLRPTDSLGVMKPGADYNTRLAKRFDSISKAVDIALKQDCNEIVITGDLYDYRNPPDWLRNRFAELIEKAQLNHLIISIITGNHETNGKDATGYDLGVLSPGTFRVITSIEFGLDIDNIAYIPEINYGLIQEFFQDSSHRDCLVFGHFGVAGSSYPNGMVERGGVPSDTFRDRPLPAFLGHIHKRQTLYDGKVIYIGALNKDDFGDRDIETGCCIVTLSCSKQQVTHVTHEFIEIPDIDMVYIDIHEDGNSNTTLEKPAEFGEGAVIKLRYFGSHDWFETECDVRKQVALLKKLGADKVIAEFNPTSEVEDVEFRVESVNASALEEAVELAAKDDGRDIGLGLGYLKEASLLS